jgi:hypothetical protein
MAGLGATNTVTDKRAREMRRAERIDPNARDENESLDRQWTADQGGLCASTRECNAGMELDERNVIVASDCVYTMKDSIAWN